MATQSRADYEASSPHYGYDSGYATGSRIVYGCVSLVCVLLAIRIIRPTAADQELRPLPARGSKAIAYPPLLAAAVSTRIEAILAYGQNMNIGHSTSGRDMTLDDRDDPNRYLSRPDADELPGTVVGDER